MIFIRGIGILHSFSVVYLYFLYAFSSHVILHQNL
ncbi:hypothetical protein DCAR_0314400 [Daucus carota subsp. sativus]|uniref:Uncharacterized protein n=1 Tax=Daucus carota subsp. sativus TaxID=79200 RepID=A0AAF1ATT6_DAUCS|nr:hypothetical protein DCAR_0314400 [Daucus carota subsp. sativus]